ncbi:MAG: peptidylprolyl isomerase [Clostridia bacterium]|nr:peptidylprolyl isomerase [Clostridia bacterium]
MLATCMFTTVAQAKTVEFTLNNTQMNTAQDTVTESTNLPAAPFILNDRTMIPVRAVSESFGAQVGWTAETRTVSIASEGKDISLVIDNPVAKVNGEDVALDAAPTIVGDITFVPVRFVSESLGYYVYFVSSTGNILVSDAEPVDYVNGLPLSAEEYMAIYSIIAPNLNDPSAQAYTVQVQNNVLANAASQRGMSLSSSDRASISEVAATVLPNYPGLLSGQLALAFENETLGQKYVTALANDAFMTGSMQGAYTENYMCAKHILVSGTDAAAKEKADGIYEELKNADFKNFDALLKEHGEDPGMEANPGGYVFTSGEMVQSFENGTKALKVGEVSEPILSEFGYHIIYRMPLPAISEEVLHALVWQEQIAPMIASAVIE